LIWAGGGHGTIFHDEINVFRGESSISAFVDFDGWKNALITPAANGEGGDAKDVGNFSHGKEVLYYWGGI